VLYHIRDLNEVDVHALKRSIPKQFLEQAGNAPLTISLNYILTNFFDNLAEDWATNSE
jgi:hypothetical protein